MGLEAILKEMIDRLVEEMVDSSSSGFDFKTFKSLGEPAQMLYYAIDNLPRLGCGISRCGFALDANRVLKLEKVFSKLETSQNFSEVKAFQEFGKEFTPEIYEIDPEYRWLIVERATTWKDLSSWERDTGLDEDWMAWAEDFQLQNKVNPKKFFQIFSRKKRWDVPDVKPTKLGLQLIEKFAFLTLKGKTDINRWDHWGITANGRLVCIDLGADADEY